MLSPPGVIAIDDQQDHLTGLANGLNRHGVACLQIHFTGDPGGIKPCPHVRIIFADLHLGTGTPSDHHTDFSTIGGLLEDSIKPSGPYFIVLWTRYPEQAENLRSFLEDRLHAVTKPFSVLPLAKDDHLDEDGEVRDEKKLIEAIVALTEKLPQIRALFHWESRVLGAAGRTVSSLLELASAQQGDKRADEVGRILARLGMEAVGKAHVASDRFRAVNEALLPILADRIANLRSVESDDEIWSAALDVGGGSTGLSVEEAAKLNRLAHVADPSSENVSERGVAVVLPESYRGNFGSTFGIDEKDAARHQFRCKDFAPDDDRFRWVLLQAQAACDHAQSQPGPVPFYLGLDLPEKHELKNEKAPASLWSSPAFEFNGQVRLLHVSARFPVSLTPGEVQDAKPIYRLREQILNDFIYHVHSHGARPGMISFRRT